MNPFLASGIILILRWLQFIASQQVLDRSLIESAALLSGMLEETKHYTESLSNYCVTEHAMSDTGKQVM
jgi:hypothetical protein